MSKCFFSGFLLTAAILLTSGCRQTEPAVPPRAADADLELDVDLPESSLPPTTNGAVTNGAVINGAATGGETGQAAERVSVRVAGVEAYQQLLEKHQGQVVLVDFWATWCPPCLEQFPHTVQLAERHAEEGLAVVSVSGDESDNDEAVLRFLRRQNATFDNLISQYGIGPETAERFEIIGGALPYYKLYDHQGQLRYQFSDAEGLQGIEPVEMLDQRVQELLAAREG